MGRLSDHFLADYPAAPGFKEPTTSREAAAAMEPDAAILREMAYAAILGAGERGLTADECAHALVRDRLSVRPRLSELRKCDPPRIVPTGEHRRNTSGRSAKVWRSA